MALRDQPYLPLYVQDFMTDEKLAECSPSSTGVYIRIMCLMHKSEIYGKIGLSNKDLSLFGGKNSIERFAMKISRLTPFTPDEVKAALSELLEEKVLYIEGNFLCQKRMVKDGQLSMIRAISGRLGAEATKSKYFQKKDETSKKTSKKEGNKTKYAEFVFLKEEEYIKLVETHGKDAADKMIEILDNYKGSHGAVYKSDYRAILSWVVDRYNNERKHGSNKVAANTGEAGKRTPRDYDAEA